MPMPVQGVGMPPPPLKPRAAALGAVKLVRLRRGGVHTRGLCFALPKNPGPGVTGAHFPFYVMPQDTGKPRSSALEPYSRHSQFIILRKPFCVMPTDFSMANSRRRRLIFVEIVLNTLLSR